MIALMVNFLVLLLVTVLLRIPGMDSVMLVGIVVLVEPVMLVGAVKPS
jgi:hypothetical protein